ncbi:MAG TPA: hypothetical protein VHM93_03290 [Candidatus Acidoferrum sp.]|jgi:photosystem II stability/assembly factor-like uncharacterized protein|nr:hypothetical protein [Candidatus Acidoferrum sp.]
MALFFLRALLGFLVLGNGDAPRPGDFRVIGPGGGGAMFHPTVSPHDLDTVLVSSDMTGAYISRDGGKSWRMFNLRGVVEFFVFDPLDPNVIYAQSSGLWRSQDQGATWNLVYPKPSSIKGVNMSSDHSDEDIVAEPNPLGSITAMAIDPADSKVFHVTGGDRKKGTSFLFLSRDTGQIWKKEADLPEPAKKVWVNPSSSAARRMLLIAGSHFIVEKTSSGIQKIPPPPVKTITDISAGFTKNGKPVIYTIGDETAFVSDDEGATWRKVSLGPGNPKLRAIATSLHNPDTAYVSYNDLEEGGVKWLGVAKTTDAGRTWRPVWKEGSDPAAKSGANIHDAWITARFGTDWGENPLALTVADQDANVGYGTDLGRTMRTTDGGANWVAVYSRESEGNAWVSTGLDVTTTYGYHFDAFDHNRQFISTTDIGLFRSEDGGKSWVSSTEGVPKEWMNTTYWLVFDPAVKGRVWSVNSWTHDLPRPKMWRRKAVLNYRGGVCRSDDGGRTWTKSNHGMEETAATHILLDPTSPPDARVLYVAAFGRGVYKSTDGGKNWTLKNTGMLQKEPFAWRIVRDAKGRLYVLVARRSEDGSIGNDGDGAIYLSTDAAEHWTPVAMPQGSNGPNGLAVDPLTPDRLYLAVWARHKGEHGDGGGIYLSEDAGKTWRQVLERDRHVYDVTIDSRDANILYAAGFESSAWRSADRGEHWTRIPGFNFKWGHRVIPDPQDPKKVYITTFGGGVWYGSVDGEDRPLDIMTPELQPGH